MNVDESYNVLLQIFSSAIENGEKLKRLRDNGCHWNEFTCASAATHGHLETLKWLRENGCPWGEWT
jgi:hypothetical protein